MKFGFSLVVRGAGATAESFRTTARHAESLGIDGLWLSAHVIVPPQGGSDYANIPGAKFPPTWFEGYWEPFTVMAHLAACTDRITLGTSVTVLPMHNPIEIAKQVAEVDQLSGGRLVFGIGVGWFKAEFEALGQDFHNRGRRTDEALELMRALWRPDPVNFEGKHYAVNDACFGPKPVQQPHPPIWVAGGGTPALRRTARFGAGFHPARISPERLAELVAELDGHLVEAGRSRDEIAIAMKVPVVFRDTAPGEGDLPTMGRPQDIVEGLRRYREAGATEFVLDVVPEEPANLDATMSRFTDEIRPHLD